MAGKSLGAVVFPAPQQRGLRSLAGRALLLPVELRLPICPPCAAESLGSISQFSSHVLPLPRELR